MTNLNSLENKQKELLINLSENELKQYIVYLTSNYYKAFRNNDNKQFNYNIGLIKDVVDQYKETYPNIIGFVYFNLFLNANLILSDTAPEPKVKLVNPFNYNLYESEELEEELVHDIKAIFNKERIRARYNEKTTNKASE